MEGHKAWIRRGIDDGVFLVVGSLKPDQGGGIVAHGTSRAALEARLSDGRLIVAFDRPFEADYDALVDALRNGAIGGAALDAFRQEPLPPEHPFWALPNLIITPHVSGYMPDYFQRMLRLFEENLSRHLQGQPLRNVVDKGLGYVPAG